MGNNNTFDSFPCCIRIGGYLVKKGIEMKKDKGNQTVRTSCYSELGEGVASGWNLKTKGGDAECSTER